MPTPSKPLFAKTPGTGRPNPADRTELSQSYAGANSNAKTGAQVTVQKKAIPGGGQTIIIQPAPAPAPGISSAPHATSTVSGTVRTDADSGDAQVYLKVSTDALLAAISAIVATKAPLSSPIFTGTATVPKIALTATLPVFSVSSVPSVTGSRGGNAALASLLTALANLGLLTDSSTV